MNHNYFGVFVESLLLLVTTFSAIVLIKQISSLKGLIKSQETVIEQLRKGIDNISDIKEWYRTHSDELAEMINKVRDFGKVALEETTRISDKRIELKDQYIEALKSQIQKPETPSFDDQITKKLSKIKNGEHV
jgi:RNA processing factor Prp31